MTLSIVTPTFNSAATLADTLDSIAQQSLLPLEVLLQDGGSRDVTLALAAGYPLVNIKSEPDGGIYDAMNRGVARAQGEVVGILNSDDVYAHSGVLAQVAAAFAADSALQAVYGDLDYVSAADLNQVVRRWRSGLPRQQGWRRGWMPPHPTFFVRRRVYEEHGLFNTQLRYAADYEFMLRCCYCGGIKTAYLPGVMVKMRVGGASNGSLRNRLRANQEDQLAWRLNGETCPPGLGLLKPLRKLRQWW